MPLDHARARGRRLGAGLGQSGHARRVSRLDLRGPEIDKLNEAALKEDREKIVKEALAELKSLTMTVVDGNFPREVLAQQNLTFTKYTMPARRNKSEFYDAKLLGPATKKQGVLKYGEVSFVEPPTGPNAFRPANIALTAALSCLLIGAVVTIRRKSTR